LSATELSWIVGMHLQLHQISLFYLLSFILFLLQAYRICTKVFQLSWRIQCDQTRQHRLPFHSDTQAIKGWFGFTLISACTARNGMNCSSMWWLSHPLFPVGVWKLRIPISRFCVTSTVPVHVNAPCHHWLVLAPLEIRILFGQTDWCVDLIGISISGCIICAGQTNGTTRSQLWGQVNFCPRILKQWLIGAQYKDTTLRCIIVQICNLNI
jgi:hypothetical protein